MDNISKLLQKLSQKERQIILEILEKIKNNVLEGLEIKKLSGFENLFRIRKGSFRIVFMKKENKNLLVNVGYRKDVYKRL